MLVCATAAPTPVVRHEVVAAAIAARPDRPLAIADVAVPRDAQGRHPLCAAWDVAAADRLEHLLAQGVRAVADALRLLRVHVIAKDALGTFDPGGRLLHNINTPDDLARAIALRG